MLPNSHHTNSDNIWWDNGTLSIHIKTQNTKKTPHHNSHTKTYNRNGQYDKQPPCNLKITIILCNLLILTLHISLNTSLCYVTLTYSGSCDRLLTTQSADLITLTFDILTLKWQHGLHLLCTKFVFKLFCCGVIYLDLDLLL